METKIWCPKKSELVDVCVSMPKFTFWPRLFSNFHSINEIVLSPEQIPSHNKKNKIRYISSSGYQKIIQKCGQFLRKSAKMCFSAVETKKKLMFKLFNNFYKNKTKNKKLMVKMNWLHAQKKRKLNKKKNLVPDKILINDSVTTKNSVNN